MKILGQARFWSLGGTFKIVRNTFYQLYTIHGSVHPEQQVHPLLFALMTGKTKNLYIKLFSEILDYACNV